jgi:glycerol-3-phosphate dehydrogenase
VVNAAGVWAGDLVEGVELRPSRGTHVVLRHEALGGSGDGVSAGLNVPVPGTRARYVFSIPQPDGLVYVGLTDEAVEPPVPDVPEPPETDIAFLLDTLSAVLSAPVRREDVIGAFCGLRPLLAESHSGSSGPSRRNSDLSRRHAVLASPTGVVTVVGGKLTTYRRMAADAVTAAVHTRRLAAGPSRTSRLPLVGAASRATLAAIEAPKRLIRRYGTEAPAVAALASADPALAEPLAEGLDVTGTELVWALRHELAMSVDDLLDRRTRLGLVPTQRAAAVPAAERIIADHQVSPPESR